MRRIVLTISALFLTATCSLAQSKHQYVDLGLSVKWATCNIGADKPEDHGDYFSWGETENKNCSSILPENAYTLEVYVRGASSEIQPRHISIAVRPVCP